MIETINLQAKLAEFSEHGSPRTVTRFNELDVMVVKVMGEFVWHKHDDTDDFFLVLKGRLDIQLRDRTVTLGPGEMYVVPKGVEHCPVAREETTAVKYPTPSTVHCPVAREETHLLLIEPTGTPNTGDAETAAPRRVV